MPPLEENGFLDSEIQLTISDLREKYSDWFNLSVEINKYCHELMYKIDANSRNMEEVLVSTLYLRSMEIYQGAIILAERGLIAPSKMLTRCIFDSTFPLCAISNDNDGKYYLEYIQTELLNRKRFTKKYKKLSNAKVENYPELDEIEKQLSKEIKEGKIKERKTIYWAEKSGLLDWYHTAYSTLSNTVHSSVRDLEQYFNLDDEGEIKEFNWGPKEEGIEELLMTLNQGMITSMLAMVTFFNQKKIDSVNEFQNKLNEITQQYINENEQVSI